MTSEPRSYQPAGVYTRDVQAGRRGDPGAWDNPGRIVYVHTWSASPLAAFLLGVVTATFTFTLVGIAAWIAFG